MKLDAAHALAQGLMQQHCLTGWTFGFDRAKRRFGCCNYTKRKITLSAYLTELNDETQVRDTILHEIAHALAGQAAGHGPVWKAHAKAIGCNARRCYGGEVVQAPARFEGTCPGCRQKIRRLRRKRISCARCCPTFHPAFLFIWSRC